MQAIRKHRGVVAPLHRENIDTDQIIPKQHLKRIERTGFGEFLFSDWRYHPDGSVKPDFALNRPEAAGCRVLVAGRKDRKSTRLNSSHRSLSRMPSSA